MTAPGAKRILFWSALCAAATFLLFTNLSGTFLWQDEAENAVIAENALKFGAPKAFDGVNLVSQNAGRDHDADYVWTYSPWLSIYLAAASFWAMGKSTFAARFPFALLGLLNLFLIHAVSRRWTSRRAADLTVWLTLLSVPYLLHARQCRYYMLDVFFGYYLFYAYQELLESKPNAGLHLIMSLLGLFHSSFLVFFPAVGGVAAHFLLCARRQRHWTRRTAATLALAALLLLPGFVRFGIFSRALGSDPHPLSLRLGNLGQCLSSLDRHLFPSGLALALAWRWDRFRHLKMPLTCLAGAVLLFGLAPQFFFRYLIGYAPLCCLLVAEIGLALYSARRAWAAAFAIIFFFTHALSAAFWTGKQRFLKTELLEYFHELRHPFNEPLKLAVSYLNAHSLPGELALVTYPDLPFMFYTRLQIIGGESGLRRIPVPRVRWILVRDESEKAFWPVDYGNFERIVLGPPNLPWGNRPDPDGHYFATFPGSEPAVLFRRVRPYRPGTSKRSA